MPDTRRLHPTGRDTAPKGLRVAQPVLFVHLMATITRSATSHPTHVLESLKLPRNAIGAAPRADRAGDADGVLTKAELDAFVPDRRGSNKGSIVEQRHLELQGVRNVDVVIQELPDDGASAIGRAAVKKPWEARLPNTQSFAMPPDLRAGRPSRVLIQAFSKDTGEVVESLRLDFPAARRLKNVDLEKMRVESARGTPVYFS